MRVQRTLEHILKPDLKDLTRWMERLSKVLGGNVSYGSTMSNTDEDINLNVWKATGSAPGVADTDFTITHKLGRVPITIVGQDTDNGGLVYRGSIPWTNTTISLRCTKASSVYNLIVA